MTAKNDLLKIRLPQLTQSSFAKIRESVAASTCLENELVAATVAEHSFSGLSSAIFLRDTTMYTCPLESTH